MSGKVDESPEILERSPEEGARRLALDYLDQASAALPRLADPEDAEALHDLRVALRRLRSCLESYEDQLGDSVPKKLARRLRRLAGATGPGRDTEVQLGWLAGQGAELGRRNHHHRQGLSWMKARLAERKDRAYGELREEVARDFAAVEEGLRRRLSVYRAEVRLDENPPPSFGSAAGEILLRHAAELGRRLARVREAGDVERAHQARISAKRLRYLADPLDQLVAAGRRHDRADPLVQRLKGLQDLLGELHDAHVMEAELAAAVSEAAAERARRLLELTLDGVPAGDHRLLVERRRPREPGLLALARLNRARRDRLFAQFLERWPGERREQLQRSAEELAAALAAAGHDLGPEAGRGAAEGGPEAGPTGGTSAGDSDQ